MFRVEAIERVNYVNKKNNRVTGSRLVVSFDADRETWVDNKAFDILYCNGTIADNVNIGDDIDVYYNKYGQVSNVVIL